MSAGWRPGRGGEPLPPGEVPGDPVCPILLLPHDRAQAAMNVDKALANCKFFWDLHGGDIGRRRAEHRSIYQWRFTRLSLKDTGYV